MMLSEQGKDLFGHSLVKIPTPRFIVFYNGETKKNDAEKLYLSDAFKDTNTQFTPANSNGPPP